MNEFAYESCLSVSLAPICFHSSETFLKVLRLTSTRLMRRGTVPLISANQLHRVDFSKTQIPHFDKEHNYPMTLHSQRFLKFSAIATTLLLLASAASLRADTVVLKNGDKFTGSAVKLDGGKLTFKTDDAADPVAITFDNVTSLTLDKAMILGTAKGKLTVTALSRTEAGIVATTASGPTTVAAAEVTVLRTPGDEDAFERSLHPSWTHAWAGAANVSLALARGNADTSTFGAGFTAARVTLHDKTAAYFTTLYAKDGNATPSTSANATGGGASYNHNLKPKVFGYVSGDFYSDQLQELDLRSIIGGGAGYHAIAKPTETLDVTGGLVWTHESYSTTAAATGTTNSFPALQIGEQYMRKFGANSVLSEQAAIYPDLSDLSQYQFTLTAGFSTKLAKMFNWVTTIGDNYTSFPPAGTLANDFVLTTGLGVTLTRP
jgi:putative salt-induced outer membrane protein YdiY